MKRDVEKADVTFLTPIPGGQGYHLGRIETVEALALRDVRLEYCITKVTNQTAVLEKLPTNPETDSLLLEVLQSSAPSGEGLLARCARLSAQARQDVPEIILDAATKHQHETGHRIGRRSDARCENGFLLDLPLPREFRCAPWRCLTCKDHPEHRSGEKTYYPV